jgi:CRISPR/Cas system CMR-associated protein Cmr1 (group 7 of RAMP superfamily)
LQPQQSGLDYLGAVALRATRSGQARKALASGSTIEVHIVWRGADDPSDDEAIRLTATIWLLSRLGCIGSRARRGFGALQFTEIKDPGFLEKAFQVFDPVVKAESPAQLQEEFASATQLLHRLRVANQTASQSPQVRNYPNSSVCTVFGTGNVFASWNNCLDWIGEQYHVFRFRSRLRLEQRLPFGSPIPVRRGQSLQIDNLNRRASPLRFRPVRLSDGKYALLGAVIKDQIDPRNRYNHNVVLQFVEELVNSNAGWHVRL